MSVLIRFEDRYGMAELYRFLVFKGQYEDRYNFKYNEAEDIYVEYGLNSSNVLLLPKGSIRQYENLGIDTVIFVFDMDSDKNNSELLSVSNVQAAIERNRRLLSEAGHSIRYLYVPVVYSAETIALYQFYDGIDSLSNLVNKNNTKLLHTNLLKVVTKIERTKELKKYEFVDYFKLREKLVEFYGMDEYNISSFGLLLQKHDIFLDEEGVVEFMTQINEHYRYLLTNEDPMVITYKDVFLNVFTEQYKQQLSDMGYNYIM